MKSLQDIYRDKQELGDIVTHSTGVPEAQIIEDFDEKFSDISGVDSSSIDLGWNKQIIVEKKKEQTFDALEITKKRKKDIKITKKRKNINFPVFLYISRFIKGLRNYSPSIFFWCVFLCVILFWMLSKIIIENRVNSWYEKLLSVKNGSLSLEEIQKNINDARFSFFIADTLFFPFSILPGEKINTTWHAIKWWKYLSKWLDQSLNLYSKIDSYISQKSLWEIYFTQLFLNIYNDISDIETTLVASKESYSNITWLPSESLHTQKDAALSSLSELLFYLGEFRTWFREFVDILGHEKRKRYLVVFQNADEIRPTGGFMWSMWLIDIFKWQIRLFQKKDVYAIEWDLKTVDYERLDAPKGLNELTEKFWLRDANYFVNVKDSSEAIKFFTDQAWLDIDGIVYVNQNILLHMLEITWPVYLDSAWESISSDNFSQLMSLLVESKISKEGTLGTPKQVLFDFMEVFIAKLVSDGKYFDYMQSIIHDMKSRDIILWNFDEQENTFLSKIWVTGNIDFRASEDFSYPVFTSLSGNKSDRYIERSYIHEVTSSQSCDHDIRSTLVSSHNMTRQQKDTISEYIESLNIDDDSLLEIQWAARNRQYVRVILPDDAVIIPSKNYEIIDYGDRQGIEFFIETQQQQRTSFSYEYSLPNPECKPYDFTLYKQPWIPRYDIQLNLDGEKFEYKNVEEDFYFEKR